jgi:predicted RNA-binding protein associated with RNAse of E/G family
VTVIITIHKMDSDGHEVTAYPTRLLERGHNWMRVEGSFDRDDVALDEWTVRRNDRMVELFFDDRWYNVFAVHDGISDALKGWYCNITRPARFEPADVFAEDLALDLLVLPDGSCRVLDEDEFEGLQLSPQDRAHALAALSELKALAASRQGPFAWRSNRSAPA